MATILALLTTSALASPTLYRAQISVESRIDTNDLQKSIARVQESVGQALTAAVHAVPDPADGSLTIWECGDKTLFGTSIRCRESILDVRLGNIVTLESVFILLGMASMIFCAVNAATLCAQRIKYVIASATVFAFLYSVFFIFP